MAGTTEANQAHSSRTTPRIYVILINALEVIATLAAIFTTLYLVGHYWAEGDLGVNATANNMALLFLYLPIYSVLFPLVAIVSHILSRLLKLPILARLFVVLICLSATVFSAYYYELLRV